MQIQLGNHFIDVKEIRKDEINDFSMNVVGNSVFCRILEDHVKELLTTREAAILEKDVDNIYALTSYINAIKDICELIKTGIPEAFKDS